MTNRVVMARVLRNRFEFSEALDREGFVAEASAVRGQILSVMSTPLFRTAAKADVNTRYAIRGQLDWEDIARSTAAGAAGGAVTGGLAGAGIGAAPGAVIGGALGAVSQPFGAMMYHTQGTMSKAESQSGDLVGAVGRLAGMLSKMGAPEAGQQIQQIAQVMQGKIGAVRKQQYNQLSEQYGLSGADDKGMWGHLVENVSNPLAYLGRSWQMRRSESERGMVREALDQTDLVDPRLLDDVAMKRGLFGIKPGWAVKSPQSGMLQGKVGAGLGAVPFIAGTATAGAVGWGWNKISDAIKGQMGVMQGLASDIQKQAAEMSKQTQDPSYMQYAGQIQQIIAQAIPQLAQQAGAQQGAPQQQRAPVPNPYAQQAAQYQAAYPTAAQAPRY